MREPRSASPTTIYYLVLPYGSRPTAPASNALPTLLAAPEAPTGPGHLIFAAEKQVLAATFPLPRFVQKHSRTGHLELIWGQGNALFSLGKRIFSAFSAFCRNGPD